MVKCGGLHGYPWSSAGFLFVDGGARGARRQGG